MTGACRRGKETDVHREGHVKTQGAQHEGRDCGDAATSPGMSRTTTNTRSQGEARKDPPLESSERTWPYQHLDLGLLASRTIIASISIV